MTATVRGISVSDRAGSVDQVLEKEYSVVYLVQTDDRNDGPSQVMSAFGVPRLGDLYISGNDFDPAAVVIGVDATQGDSPWEWDVEVTYSTNLDDNPGEQIENPLLQPADISYGFASRRVRAGGYYDTPSSPPSLGLFEKAFVAPNGEPFNPQPEVEISEPVLRIQRNQQSIAGILAIGNTVNSTPFYGADARQLRLTAPEATRKWDKNIGHYWDVSYSFLFRWEKWDLYLPNRGTYYLDNSQVLKYFATDDAHPRVGNLTSTGGDNGIVADPTFTTVRYYREIDFNTLGLL